ncbi:CoA-acylating methylmalonate-semialdehyde dehydrogenase [Emcibacteraceae bacterium]|uniref:CoA-acylating methylmalonate-semialdehyde dehydrogenase n=1 Tax=Pseudemcibacter sp. TaxID=2943293 RepID=UPI00230F428E|nr:CoA-acylating methylmalonate-semialdehyde dehydrogenase [Emcibacteraceae bacterium]MDA9770441.1 CoA-acylating methylmalonate-semialdehyde dehydrogenase [Emcibacteraceae bacterium]
MYKIDHYIGGKNVAATGGRSAPIYDPSTGQVQGEVGLASTDDVDTAVETAAKAFESWSDTGLMKRVSIMFKFRELLEQNRDELCEHIVKEHGKVWDDAMGELTRGFEIVENACGIPEMLKGEFSEQVGSGIDVYNTRQALGVVCSITPFNFPAMVPLWTIPLAIACGNTFILKPSERDPSCANVMARLFSEAGLPDGVFNVVHGDKVAVDHILKHNGIEAVSFVGSTPVAEYIYHTGTANNKRVQALGGAKNHAIIMPDADIDQAVDAMIGAAFGSAGERCMALSVAVAVGDNVADEMITKIKDQAENIKVGCGMSAGNEMGPLITKEHCARVKGLISEGEKDGAKVVLDGRTFEGPDGKEDGYFCGPTILDNVTKDMSVYKEEIFGPVLVVVRVNSYGDAVKLVQDHEYGNGTCIFTREGDIARNFTRKIKVGMVGVNVPLPVPLAFHSFGGWKRSIFGDHHMYGPEGVRFWTKIKTVTSRWPTSIMSGANLSFPSSD